MAAAILLSLAAVAMLAGVRLILIAIRDAPEARETERGLEITAEPPSEDEERIGPKAPGTRPQFS